MSPATVELDFFGMEKESSAQKRLFDRRRSFRGIQSAISKINPQVLKTVIASGSLNHILDAKASENAMLFDSKKSLSVPSTPKGDLTMLSSLPVYKPSPRPASDSPLETAPMTIFYNGTVTVFNVPRNKAENILKLAEEECSKANAESGDPKLAVVSSTDQPQLLEQLDGDYSCFFSQICRSREEGLCRGF